MNLFVWSFEGFSLHRCILGFVPLQDCEWFIEIAIAIAE